MKIETAIWLICLAIFIAAKLFDKDCAITWTEIFLWFYTGILSIENKRLRDAAAKSATP